MKINENILETYTGLSRKQTKKLIDNLEAVIDVICNGRNPVYIAICDGEIVIIECGIGSTGIIIGNKNTAVRYWIPHTLEIKLRTTLEQLHYGISHKDKLNDLLGE